MAHQFHPQLAKNYQLLEHTADICIEVKGKTPAGLFENAGLAVFDIIAKKHKQTISRPELIKIKQKSATWEELLVNWLNELLSLSAVKKLIFTDLKIKKIEQGCLEAVATGESSENYQLNVEVKAATYYGLQVKSSAVGWSARIILDV